MRAVRMRGSWARPAAPSTSGNPPPATDRPAGLGAATVASVTDAAQPGPGALSLASVTGIDVSAWQPRIDWPQVAAAGHRFAYLKLTEGETYRSPTYEAQWSGAQDAGLAVGPYHFAEPDASALDDADRFVDAHKPGFHEGVLSPLMVRDIPDSEVLKLMGRQKASGQAISNARDKLEQTLRSYYAGQIDIGLARL